MDWYHDIFEALSYSFMQRALIVASVTGVVCATLSCFLVLKGWSLMGDAISHAVLPGIVIAFWINIPLFIGALGSGLICAVGTGYIKDNSRIKEDTVMGIIFSGMFALGLVLFSYVDTNQHLTHILLGNLLGTTKAEFIQTLCIALFTIMIILLKIKDFILYCFDAQHARAIGLNVTLLHYSLLVLLTLTIITSLQAVGAILVIAMLIAPGITAYTLCRHFPIMLITAISTSLLSCVLGTIISYIIDGATAPCIVLIQALFFILSQFYVHCLKPKYPVEDKTPIPPKHHITNAR